MCYLVSVALVVPRRNHCMEKHVASQLTCTCNNDITKVPSLAMFTDQQLKVGSCCFKDSLGNGSPSQIKLSTDNIHNPLGLNI